MNTPIFVASNHLNNCNMKTRIKRQKALQIANALVAKGWSFSDGQKRGWEVVRAIEAMRKDEIMIRFCKEGEEIPEQRTAQSLKLAGYQPKGQTKKSNPLQICFFDTVKNQPRSFKVERFFGFVAAA